MHYGFYAEKLQTVNEMKLIGFKENKDRRIKTSE